MHLVNQSWYPGCPNITYITMVLCYLHCIDTHSYSHIGTPPFPVYTFPRHQVNQDHFFWTPLASHLLSTLLCSQYTTPTQCIATVLSASAQHWLWRFPAILPLTSFLSHGPSRPISLLSRGYAYIYTIIIMYFSTSMTVCNRSRVHSPSTSTSLVALNSSDTSSISLLSNSLTRHVTAHV